MKKTFLSFLTAGARKNGGAYVNVRRHPRRNGPPSAGCIRGQSLPVENWSLGGVLLCADEWRFGEGEDVDFTVIFALRQSPSDLRIDHSGRVVRKSEGKVAIQFAPLSEAISRKFQRVIDDCASLHLT